MKPLIILLFVAMLALSGCITTQKACCPSKDVVFYVITPMGLMPVEVEKDYFNKDAEGEYYIGAKKYNETMEEQMKDELEKQSDEAVKETNAELDKI